MTAGNEAGSSPRKCLDAAFLAAGFFVAGSVSILVSRFSDGIAGVWFANALAFVMLARRARRPGVLDFIALAAGSLAVNVVFFSDLATVLILPLINAGQVMLSLYLVRRAVGGPPLRIANAGEFVQVLGLAGIAATAAAVLVFLPVTSWYGGWPPLWTGWTLMSANALGYAMVLPPLLFGSRAALAKLSSFDGFARVATVCLGSAGAGCLSLAWSEFPFALAMLPSLLAALYLTVFEAALVCSFTGAALMAGAMVGLVPGHGHGAAAFSGGFQLAVAIAVLTPLMVAQFVQQIVEGRRRIADAETRWNFALTSTGQGIWDLDVRKGRISYSDGWAKLLGYEPDELDGDPDHWLTLIHPDDRQAVETADRAHQDGRTPYFEAEFRIRRKDGRWIWILDRGKIIERDGDGNVARAIGSFTDITARKEAEQWLVHSAAMLEAEKERLRVTLQSIGDAVICTDPLGSVTFMNPIAEKLTGVAATEAIGRPLAKVYMAVDEDTGQPLDLEAIFNGRRLVDHNSRAVLLKRNGTRCSIRQVISSIRTGEGKCDGSIIVFQDFTDARTLQRQLAYAAAHDALTGLPNRSSFIRTMKALVETAQAGSMSRQFMFIDLDRFKRVNDTAGHAAGDALLKLSAQAIRNALGPGDIVARLGGDEFAVLLKSGSAAAAEITAKTVIEAVLALEFVWNDHVHRIGASIGIAPVDADSGEVDEIIARADAACYAAKAAGRGCFRIAVAGTAETPFLPPAVAAGS
ncbi:diguanylate cyclase domain-containing protein [Mesorhizobium sp. SP-1A]|uniref:diguanylate cyclase domain-containing protein n=1 Tax=Mesorhizobium sp. SP-1A TaxID=3077840 RepID=UPI0028F74383|nr:diguanylate cyclase [Mesorhizobium sp. SP-1A]